MKTNVAKKRGSKTRYPLTDLQDNHSFTKQGVQIITKPLGKPYALCFRWNGNDCIMVDSKCTREERSILVDFLIKALKEDKLRSLEIKDSDGEIHQVRANKAVIHYPETKL